MYFMYTEYNNITGRCSKKKKNVHRSEIRIGMILCIGILDEPGSMVDNNVNIRVGWYTFNNIVLLRALHACRTNATTEFSGAHTAGGGGSVPSTNRRDIIRKTRWRGPFEKKFTRRRKTVAVYELEFQPTEPVTTAGTILSSF